jgi:isopentenyl-diphosphate delta-isomerase
MSDIKSRKSDHINICLDDPVESSESTQFGMWRLDYRALPEIALEDVDLSTSIAGKTLSAPLIIGAMTGGTAEAKEFNYRLASAAEAKGIGFALGSGRIAIEKPELLPTFSVREVAPTALVFANLGAVQFNYGVTGSEAAQLCHALGADALNLHLNPLQEAIQPNGDTNFRGLTERIGQAIADIDVPVFVKEVGAGIGKQSAELLASLPIAGVETAGVGGTSWSRVEAMRTGDHAAKATGMTLGGLGVPTAESIIHCRRAMPDRVVIASGGLRTALDMAKAIALGADAVACALPFLKAASEGDDALMRLIDEFIHTLRVAHFVCGARSPSELRGRVIPRKLA